MRKEDLEYRDEPELDSQKMAYTMGIMLFLLIVPFMLQVTGVISILWMTILFIPGLAVVAYLFFKYRRKW